MKLSVKKLYGPWMGFNCLKVTEPILGDGLPFSTKLAKFPGNYLIDLGGMKAT